MTRPAHTVAPRCGSNPDCMILSVDSPEAVARLADVFPALAASGGYRGPVSCPDYPNGKLVDEGHDLLDYDGGVAEDPTWRGGSWQGVVWYEGARLESIVVQIATCRTDEGWKLITRTHARALGFASEIKVARVMGGASYKDKRPNVRRETAKAVAHFLAVVCSPEAVAERAQVAAERAQARAERLEHQFRRALVLAPLVGSTTSEPELRAWMAEELEHLGGDSDRLAKAVAAHLTERAQELDEDQRRAWERADADLSWERADAKLSRSMG